MENLRWQRLENIFEQVVDLPDEARSEKASQLCGEDSEMLRDVLGMIAADADSGGFIESPALEAIRSGEFESGIHESVPPDLVGKRIGAYSLVRELGRGGMGAVFLASRADNEFEKLVAVKLIKRGMDTDFILRRFRNERQILARLDHPNIASLLDGGTTDDGVPYFVMEYVDGEPIHQFCDRHRLTVRERLELFLDICGAVHYAHQNLIIHRDLKPGNILVRNDRSLKLLDFGIAKILDPAISSDSLAHTLTGMRLMTPEYAAPEQVRGERLSPATDTYSLGILLYEILTGRRPFRFPSAAPHEIARVICEEPPRSLLSFLDPARADVEAAGADEAAERRSTDVDGLREELRGLAPVIQKALRKSPQNRYATALEFSEDVRSFLEDGSVSAVPLDAEPISSSENDGNVSLAVLPFEIVSIDQVTDSDTGDFLSVGLVDALITRLSNLRTVAVRPTGSVLRFAGEEQESAAGKLNADFVLQGRIQRVRERVRVATQLVKVAEETTVWAGSFEESSEDILSLQDSIAGQVAEALAETLSNGLSGGIKKRGTASPKAYDAYLRGRYHWHSYTDNGLAKALVYFYEAIALDPEFARAYSGVADYHNLLSVFGIMPSHESFPAAKEAARKAVELDDELAEAHVSLGITAFAYDWDFESSERSLRRAIELSPNLADAHLWYAQLLSLTGRHERAVEEISIAERLNPLSPSVLLTSAFTYRNARKFERSLEKLRQALRIEPNYHIAQQAFSWLILFLGNTEECIRMCESAMANSGRSTLSLYAYGYSLAVAGRESEARAVLEELSSRAESQYVPPVYIAFICTALNDLDRTFEWLFKAVEVRDFWVAWVPVDPRFDSLKGDPRFRELVSLVRPETESPDIHQSRIPTRRMTALVSQAPASVRESPGKRMWILGVILPIALLAIGFIGGSSLGLFGTGAASAGPAIEPSTALPDTRGKSLAVMPFSTDGHLEGEQSLGTGLAESLYRQLGNAAGLSVRPALINIGEDRPVKEVAAAFGVDFLLRGTLEKHEGSVRVSVELIDARSEKLIWAQRFDQDEAEFPALQSEISRKVLSALTVRLSESEKERFGMAYTDSPEAYQLYLAGRYLMQNRSADNLRKAERMFEQAKEKDPEFALAYVGLADSNSLLSLYQIPPPPDAFAKAKKYARRALELDEGLAEAHASLGYVLFYGEWNRTEAEKHFRRSIALNPSYSTAHHWFGLALAAMGKHEEAIKQMDAASELEPRSPIVHTAGGLVRIYARRYDEAIAKSREALKLDEGFVPAYKTLRITYEIKRDFKNASEAFLRERTFSGNLVDDHPGWAMIGAQVNAVGERNDEATRKLDLSLASPVVTGNPRGYAYEIAIAYALLDDPRNSLAWLRKARDSRDHSFNFVLVDPRLDQVRKYHGFNDIANGDFR